MSRSLEHDELASGLLGERRSSCEGRDRVVLAVDDEHGATDAPTEGLGLLRFEPPSLVRRDQGLAVGLERPADGVLDRLCRVRLREHLRHEELDEVAVVPQPLVPVVLRPAFVAVVLAVEVAEDDSLG